MTVYFSESKVEYASHQLSLYYGECPHECSYCFVDYLYRKRNYRWAVGELRNNPKAFNIARNARADKIDCLVVSFTGDPFPSIHPTKALSEKARESIHYTRLTYLMNILDILESRKINTKVLTKNADILEVSFIREPYKHISFGFSITTNGYNDQVTRHFEPNASTVNDRLFSLNEFRIHGFKTWVSIEPILPGTNVLGLIAALVSMGIDEIWVGKNNYDPELVHAYDWKALANSLWNHRELFEPRLKIKKDLLKHCDFFKEVPLNV